MKSREVKEFEQKAYKMNTYKKKNLYRVTKGNSVIVLQRSNKIADINCKMEENTPEKVHEINENREVSTPLKGSNEIHHFSPKNAEKVCLFSDNEIAKDDANFTPDRPKTFSCRRRQNISYFSSGSPKGILRSVPMEFGTPDFHNERTLCETLESTESEISVAEIWSNVSLNSFKNRKSADSEHSDFSSTETDLISKEDGRKRPQKL
ncbi:hypothetical protein TNIN_462251 [Trichonephila inaurata madagascariensis]|uniref:Uncharacterized protein n=1 Tax=Trichonephila inaurata madagascariensis TaxID=2747483 RepID=A0A8X6YWH0_9ARAC|nr:hypothetical protein TNIN_462251 [Trichonephila inaurata madagascariensis]